MKSRHIPSNVPEPPSHIPHPRPMNGVTESKAQSKSLFHPVIFEPGVYILAHFIYKRFKTVYNRTINLKKIMKSTNILKIGQTIEKERVVCWMI